MQTNTGQNPAKNNPAVFSQSHHAQSSISTLNDAEHYVVISSLSSTRYHRDNLDVHMGAICLKGNYAIGFMQN
jgi:hypothetical protein